MNMNINYPCFHVGCLNGFCVGVSTIVVFPSMLINDSYPILLKVRIENAHDIPNFHEHTRDKTHLSVLLINYAYTLHAYSL